MSRGDLACPEASTHIALVPRRSSSDSIRLHFAFSCCIIGSTASNRRPAPAQDLCSDVRCFFFRGVALCVWSAERRPRAPVLETIGFWRFPGSLGSKQGVVAALTMSFDALGPLMCYACIRGFQLPTKALVGGKSSNPGPVGLPCSPRRSASPPLAVVVGLVRWSPSSRGLRLVSHTSLRSVVPEALDSVSSRCSGLAAARRRRRFRKAIGGRNAPSALLAHPSSLPPRGPCWAFHPRGVSPFGS